MEDFKINKDFLDGVNKRNLTEAIKNAETLSDIKSEKFMNEHELSKKLLHDYETNMAQSSENLRLAKRNFRLSIAIFAITAIALIIQVLALKRIWPFD